MAQSSTGKTTEIRGAADRLQRALKTLELSLDPLVERVTELEQGSVEAENLKSDRTRLESALDAAQTRELEFKEREKEISQLAHQTTQELDSVISQVLLALGEG